MDLDRLDKCWFAIQVRPRYEFLVACILHSKGFEEFLPSYKTKRQWSDRKKQIELPLFPGYVFCRFNAQIRVPIVTTPGFLRIVSPHMPIPDSEIEAIQAVVTNGVPASPCKYITAGSRVQLIGGPLAGMQGILVSYRNQHRLVLSVNLVQSSISVEVDHTDVRPIVENPYRATAGEQRTIGGPVMTALASDLNVPTASQPDFC